jgi:hypothetical protein
VPWAVATRRGSHCSGSGSGGDGGYLCSTPPSRDGVECVLAFPEAVVTEAAMVERSGVESYDVGSESDSHDALIAWLIINSAAWSRPRASCST